MHLIFNDISNQQDAAKFVLLILFKLALHVSGDSFAHHQEHFDCICSFLGTMHRLYCLLPTGETLDGTPSKPLLERCAVMASINRNM
jgi:hypothetical protein